MGDYEVMDESSNYFGELHFYSSKLDLPMEDLKNSWEIFAPNLLPQYQHLNFLTLLIIYIFWILIISNGNYIYQFYLLAKKKKELFICSQ